MIIDGRAIATQIIAELQSNNKLFSGCKMIGILVGDNLASFSFLREKKRTATSLGIAFSIKKIAIPITEEMLVAKVRKLTGNPAVIGAIVQWPIPIDGIDVQNVLNAVPYEKDIDCLSEQRAQEFYANPAVAYIAPPVVGAVKRILAHVGISDICGKRMTIYGFGQLIGKPVNTWACSCGAEVAVLRRNSTPAEITTAITNAEIIVTGVGVANLIHVPDVQPGTIVIDFGYPSNIDFVAAHANGVIVTPTPGGTGPVLVAELFRNLYTLK